jgi:sugar-specific transcriptional regulator TrmB
MEEELKELGLSEGESKLYLTLLREGESGSTALSKKSKIHRSYVYELLNKLQEKGLVTQTNNNKHALYQANNPEQLKNYLEYKTELAKALLPQLNELTKLRKKEDTQLEILRGKLGLRRIFEDLLQKKEDYYYFGKAQVLDELLPYAIPQILRRIDEIKLHEKAILPKSEKGVITPAKNHSHRYLSETELIHSGFLVYSDTVVLLIWDEQFTQIMIQDEKLAKSYKENFNLLWKLAEE